MLRFGDGTPFPYGQDFLEVLVDAVEACTAMFEAADELDHERARARDARRDRDAEDARLEQLEKAIGEAIAKAVPVSELGARGTTHAQRTAKRALVGARRTIADSRAELKRLYAVAAAGPRWEPTAMRVHDAAAAFFERRCLPETRWTWSWDAQVTYVEATSRSGPFGATYDVELDPIWRAPVRIGVLIDGGSPVRLPVRRMVGAPVVRDLPIDRMWLASARRDGDGVRLVIRTHASASPGWLLRIPTGNTLPSVVALDKHGREVGLDYELGREDVIAKLVAAIESAMTAMLRNRRAREVRLGDLPVSAIAEVTAAPKLLLDTLAPTMRAIRAKSKVSGELSLKRDVAAGVREELFVPRTALTARYANLSEPYRALLDAAGLGRALTNNTMPLTLVTAAA